MPSADLDVVLRHRAGAGSKVQLWLLSQSVTFCSLSTSLSGSSALQGGRHVDYVADQVVSKLIDVVKKKNKAGVVVKPFQVRTRPLNSLC